jgi:colanic acid biosynthesis glycosyl transferase WcaI
MKIVFICQWYPPEYAPIGVMFHELARDLSACGHIITVITGFPNHPAGVLFNGYNKKLFTDEIIDGVKVTRCYLYTSPRKNIFHRALNYITFSVTSFVAVLRLEKQDLLFIVSPPLSNGMISILLKKLKGLKFVFNVQDIYPDAAIESGIARNPLLIRIVKCLELCTYRSATRISVISEGFKENLARKGVPGSKISVVSNWLDSQEIKPMPKDNRFSRSYGLTEKFVVLYSGTIGIVSGAEILLECAAQLESTQDILFLFVGEGVIKDKIIEAARERQLGNVLFLPFQPRDILSEVQSTSDVSIVTMGKGKGRFSVPSKILGYMASARPVIASVDTDSDTKRIIEKSNCGICVDAEDAEGLKRAILDLYHDRRKAQELGRNGRDFMKKHCDRKEVTAQYQSLFISCVGSALHD